MFVPLQGAGFPGGRGVGGACRTTREMHMRPTSIRVAPAAALAAIAWVVFTGGTAAQRSALDASLARLQADRGLYGLTDATRELAVRVSRRDTRGVTHTRFDQYHLGIRVFEGEAITHASGDGTVSVTSDIKPNLNVRPCSDAMASTERDGERFHASITAAIMRMRSGAVPVSA